MAVEETGLADDQLDSVTAPDSEIVESENAVETNVSGERGIASRGYIALLVTQFLGAANDNVVKMVITYMVTTGIWREQAGEGGQAIPALCLTVPFILLSGYAGEIADRFSKRTNMLWVKIAEVPLALMAGIGFATHSYYVSLAALTLLGIQSTFFGPSKFGVIPELVRTDQLSPANGLINMLSNLGVIAGIVVSGPVSDAFYPGDVTAVEPLVDVEAAGGMRFLPGIVVFVIAILGLAAIMLMPKLKAANPTLKISLNPFKTYYESFRDMGTGPLLVVVCAWSGFYMIGSMALMIIPEYQEIFNISYSQNALLLVVISIALAIGSVTAGLISGKTIKPLLIPCGGLGMTIAFVIMGLIPPNIYLVTAMLALTGFSAGFYIVPLQALIQYLSPADERGRFLGTANALSFVFISAGSIVYLIAANPLQMKPQHINLICAVFALVGMAIGVWQMKRVMAGKSSTVHVK